MKVLPGEVQLLPEHLVHGTDVVDLVPPVLHHDDGGDAGHESVQATS